MTTAALVSGGVDSAVSVHLLCEQGVRPDLFYIKIGRNDDELSCTAEEDIELANVLARRYGLKLEVVDLEKEYWDSVIGYVVDRVKRGLTPNSDVMCNRFIKFGSFVSKVGYRYDQIATGHYATTHLDQQGRVWLGTALDPVKDQTDFLAQLDYAQIAPLRFPVGGLMKSEVRQIALDNKLPGASRRDSQGICFLGKINYDDLLRRLLGEKLGDVIERTSGKLVGRHRGHWFHTIGQRKGLGLAGGPWFVVDKDVEQNILYVAHGYQPEASYAQDFRLAGFHFLTANPWNEGEEPEILFKIRHTEPLAHGRIRMVQGDAFVHADHAVQGVAPGQFGVIYTADGKLCIGSGEIRR